MDLDTHTFTLRSSESWDLCSTCLRSYQSYRKKRSCCLDGVGRGQPCLDVGRMGGRPFSQSDDDEILLQLSTGTGAGLRRCKPTPLVIGAALCSGTTPRDGQLPLDRVRFQVNGDRVKMHTDKEPEAGRMKPSRRLTKKELSSGKSQHRTLSNTRPPTPQAIRRYASHVPHVRLETSLPFT